MDTVLLSNVCRVFKCPQLSEERPSQLLSPVQASPASRASSAQWQARAALVPAPRGQVLLPHLWVLLSMDSSGLPVDGCCGSE